MKKLNWVAIFLLASPAFASFQPFEKTVTCKSKNDGAGLVLKYDKTTHPDFGWAGTISVDLSSGNDTALSAFVQNLGLATDGSNHTVHREGAAGQVGNWIQQDTGDPIV